MRHFIASGLWFLHDAPANRVAGTLHYSERGLHLKLLGSLRGGWSPKIDPYSLIYGVVSKNPYGEFVTLIDCFTKKNKLSSAGIGSELIYCNRGILGDKHLPLNHDEFEALNLRLSYLSDWFGRKGITSKFIPGEQFGLEIRYRKPEPARLLIDKEVVTVGLSASSSESSHKLILAEEAHLLVKPIPHFTADQIHSAYVRPLQNLLTFATDTPNAEEQVELRGERVSVGQFDLNRKYYLLFSPIFRLKRKKDRLVPNEMLFSFEETLEAGLNIFEKWFNFTRRHEAFCTVYFASQYAPARYLDERFLRLMSAFALLTTSLCEAPQRTADFIRDLNNLASGRFADRDVRLLSHVIPTSGEVEMPFHLLRLLEEYRPLMSRIVGDDFVGFVRSISSTLSFLERRMEVGGSPTLQGDDLYYAFEKISSLVKIVILNELGFDGERITRFVERNKLYVHLSAL